MKPGSGKKVLVAMSGGVDSSVTAALLQDEGYEVVGCFMRLGSDDSIEKEESGVGGQESQFVDAEQCASRPAPQASSLKPQASSSNRQGCCSVNDAADARLVAAMLGVPFYVMNFRKDFGRIKEYFAAEYHAGRTPNPCVRCNDWLKFGKLFDYARSIDADYIATGHYARVERGLGLEACGLTEREGRQACGTDRSDSSLKPQGSSRPPRPRLLRGLDHHKDQSYVLFGMKRDRLQRMLLPIGAFHKPQVRAIAREKGLPVFDKPDSYEICFVPDNDYRGVLERRDPAAFHKGAVVDTQGNIIGEHEGHQNFTIGQRRGLPIALGYPAYVVDKDAATNTVVLGKREDVQSIGCRADQTNWLIDDIPTQPRRVTIKIRSNSDPVPGEVWTTGPDSLEVRFDESQHAVTPGQAVVCYEGEELIGGGWISEATPSPA